MLHLENFFEKSFALLLTTPKKKNILKKYLTNRKRQDIMKSQTKKNNSSKILEINLTRNLKKEVQSNGIVIKI